MTQYASTTDSLTLKGTHWISVSMASQIIEGVANTITATLKDIAGEAVADFAGEFEISAEDSAGLPVQVGITGTTYYDSILVTPTSGVYTDDLYFDLPEGVTGPIYVAVQVAEGDEIKDYRPYGVDEVARVSYTEESYGIVNGATEHGTSWSAARGHADSLTPQTSGVGVNFGGAFSTGPTIDPPFDGTTRLYRGGRRITGLVGAPTSMRITYDKFSYELSQTLNIQIRYSNTAPSTGEEFRTTGTVLTTVALLPGALGSVEIDGSAAIDGENDIYIWAVSECDVNNTGYPPAGSYFSSTIRITEIEAS